MPWSQVPFNFPLVQCIPNQAVVMKQSPVTLCFLLPSIQWASLCPQFNGLSFALSSMGFLLPSLQWAFFCPRFNGLPFALNSMDFLLPSFQWASFCPQFNGLPFALDSMGFSLPFPQWASFCPIFNGLPFALYSMGSLYNEIGSLGPLFIQFLVRTRSLLPTNKGG